MLKVQTLPSSFNEAAALLPRKATKIFAETLPAKFCYKEAAALLPRKATKIFAETLAAKFCFNEAAALLPRKAYM